MIKIDTKHFKEKLLNELKTLETELKTVGHKNPDNKSDWEPDARGADSLAVEDGDMAEEIMEYESNTAILKPLERQWGDVKKALTKIEKDVYGICEVCNNQIETERLEANASARTCTKDMEVKLG